jgi:hypothetical protein
MLRTEIESWTIPSYPKALALLGAILPAMERRTRRSFAWILVTGLSVAFYLGLGSLVFLLWSLQ